MKNKKTYTKKIFEATYVASNPEEIKKLKASNVLAKDDVVKIDKDANNSSMALSENDKNIEEPIHVEYLSNMKGEEPFEIYGDKYQYVWAKYANGERYPAVYCFKDETTVSYLWFKENIAKHQNLHEDNNEENTNYDFDTTNLYKFLKDALYQLKDIDYAEGAKILEQELLKNFDVNKKQLEENIQEDNNLKSNEAIITMNAFMKAMLENGVSQEKAKHVAWNLSAESFKKTRQEIRRILESTNNHLSFEKEKISSEKINKIVNDSIKYSTTNINRPKDAKGNDITLKTRVVELNTNRIGHVLQFALGDNNEEMVFIDWMDGTKSKVLPNTIVVDDNSRIVREEENTNLNIIEIDGFKYQFLNNEKIKEGDWFIRNGKIFKCGELTHLVKNEKWYKIIASNNPELGLPSISDNLSEQNNNVNNIISFKLAKILKEKGFHKPVSQFYTNNGEISTKAYYKTNVPTSDYNAYPNNPNAKPFYKYGYSAPTIDMVLPWIKEKYNMDLNSEYQVLQLFTNNLQEQDTTVDNTNIPKLQQDVKILVDKLETVLKPYLNKINKPLEQAELIAAIAEKIGVPRTKLTNIISTLKTVASKTNTPIQQDVNSTSQVNENENNNLKKVRINGYEYYVDEMKRTLYTDENLKNKTSWDKLTSNERQQIYDQLKFGRPDLNENRKVIKTIKVKDILKEDKKTTNQQTYPLLQLLTMSISNQRGVDGVIDFLKSNYPTLTFVSKIVKVGDRQTEYFQIDTTTEISDEEKKELYQKLKNTSTRFVDMNRNVYELR